mmetsp:Transcript_17075/g.34911  ORF Transcript_17075/g.34911 Transcript_17075/m.34911 type:complete len:153 (+) Transcript_17075:304-762(+)
MGGIVNKMRGNPEDRAMVKNTQLNVEMDNDRELREAVYQKPERKLGGVWAESLQQTVGRKVRPPDKVIWKEMVEEILYDNNNGGCLVRTGSGNLSQSISQESLSDGDDEEMEEEGEEEEDDMPLGKKHYFPLAREEEEEDEEGLQSVDARET